MIPGGGLWPRNREGPLPGMVVTLRPGSGGEPPVQGVRRERETTRGGPTEDSARTVWRHFKYAPPAFGHGPVLHRPGNTDHAASTGWRTRRSASVEPRWGTTLLHDRQLATVRWFVPALLGRGCLPRRGDDHPFSITGSRWLASARRPACGLYGNCWRRVGDHVRSPVPRSRHLAAGLRDSGRHSDHLCHPGGRRGHPWSASSSESATST